MTSLLCPCECECRTAMYCSAHRSFCEPGTCSIPGSHQCVVELVSERTEDADD